MDTGCRVSWTGRPLTVLEAMSKIWGVEGEATQGNMDLDDQLTQEQFHSSQVGCISNDFDVNEFELEEEEQEEEDEISDVVSSDSGDLNGDQ